MPEAVSSEPTFHGAVAPDRRVAFQSSGLSIRGCEWGDPRAQPVLLWHGMFDCSRGFDLIAAKLAERFRVIALDQRGHGDSDWADGYAWPADIRDLGNVMHQIGRPVHLVGHSKGGGQVTNAASTYPEFVRKVVNIDGFGPPSDEFEPRPGVEVPPTIPGRFAVHLDRQRRTARSGAHWRAAPDFEELVSRRKAQNPRLSVEWLRYFLWFAARRDADGWRWKVDPRAAGGFGPFRAAWIGPGFQSLTRPMLAIWGTEPDTWGPIPEATLRERLSYVRDLETAQVEGTGHFVHMERPDETAKLLLEFLD